MSVKGEGKNRVIKLTKKDSFIAAEFNDDEARSFELLMHQVNGGDIFNLMSHLAIAIESQSGVTVEEIAERLVKDQGDFKQEERAW